jgi:hypothetical protein
MNPNSFFNKATSFLLIVLFLFSSCASMTMIQSDPEGARLYLNGENVGTTPYSHTDTRIVGSQTTVRLEKHGYETLNTVFSRDEEVDIGAVIGGFFVFIPFLWTMKYKPFHTYEMKPLTGDTPDEMTIKTKADRLRELKELLDEKIITPEEFEREKKKILE